MDLEEQRFNLAQLVNSLSYHRHHQHSSFTEHNGAALLHDHLDNILKSIVQDDRTQFITHSSLLAQSLSLPYPQNQTQSLDRSIISHLLHFCCMFDAVECATALFNGEIGMVPLVNETDAKGRTALHTAAEAHAPRCIELLLRKRARTDLKTKDGRGLLALDLSLCSSRMDVIWNPDEYSVEDLIVCLGEKDLRSVKFLTERTKEIADVAYARAIEGCVVPVAALLMVAAEKVNETVMILHDADSGCKEKTTIYESLVREALALGLEDTSTLTVVKMTRTPTQAERAERRKLLLCEIELLQLFGSVADPGCTDRKVISPLILATQAGDEAVIRVLLKTNKGIDDTDAEGNSPLHWCLKKFKMPPHQQMKILSLLLEHGARVSQKSKLGLTAVHIAAASGNLEALQVLIDRDPGSINSMTEMKETPLFFAVKNDRMDCTELLLCQGANSEVLNLRQRPIDMAKSQDMRFMLSSSNIILMNRPLTLQQKYVALPQGYETIPEFDGVPDATDNSLSNERISFGPKTEICRYFESRGGCIRGSKCYFAHGEEELQQVKQGVRLHNHPAPEELRRKIFVGGLPLSLDSDSLRRNFEEQFGLVEDAIVVCYQEENEVHSRGFGFVTFKHEKSASAAVESHYVTISGKQVEVKSAVQYPKPLSPVGSLKMVHTKHEEESGDMHQQQPQTSGSTKDEETKLESMSWVDRLLKGQPKLSSSNHSQVSVSPCIEDQSTPTWLRIFVKWLPGLLKNFSLEGVGGEYALSSLKGDFRSKFGIELDHASLGFPKLSDFMRSIPHLCRLKVISTGHTGPANHMIILPRIPTPQKQALQRVAKPNTTVDDSGRGKSRKSKPHQDSLSLSQENGSPMSSIISEGGMHDLLVRNQDEENRLDIASTKVLFSKPYELFGSKTCKDGHGVGGTRGKMVLHQKRHLVLEALCSRRGSSSLFLRDIDFYKDYISSVSRGTCFGCKHRKSVWANFPCQHLLWCSDCKLEAAKAAGSLRQKCVICNARVEKTNPAPWKEGFHVSY